MGGGIMATGGGGGITAACGKGGGMAWGEAETMGATGKGGITVGGARK
jgi:hypothetical protein